MTAPEVCPRIVLVDDHELFRQSTAELLDLLGYPTLAESSPLEALAKLEQIPTIELLITDLRMPQMSGLELAQRVAVSRPDVSIVLMSSHTLSPVPLACCSRFLTKPFTARQLQTMVDELVDQRQI